MRNLLILTLHWKLQSVDGLNALFTKFDWKPWEADGLKLPIGGWVYGEETYDGEEQRARLVEAQAKVDQPKLHESTSETCLSHKFTNS